MMAKIWIWTALKAKIKSLQKIIFLPFLVQAKTEWNKNRETLTELKIKLKKSHEQMQAIIQMNRKKRAGEQWRHGVFKCMCWASLVTNHLFSRPMDSQFTPGRVAVHPLIWPYTHTHTPSVMSDFQIKTVICV